MRYSGFSFKTEVKYANLRDSLLKALLPFKSKRFYLIDEQLFSLYPDKFSFLKDNFILIKSEEENKSLALAETIIAELKCKSFTKDDCLIGVGGGIVTDLTAFIASIYKRGTKLILIPTTFLAMIDAAIGGKTAVNHSGVKNLLGTFYPATAIVIIPEFLKTLPEQEMLNGWAECIKISLLAPNKLYDLIKRSDANKELIRKAISMKEKFCRNDLYDKQIRRKLNLGHTTAHIIESASSYQIPHGIAVSLGIRVAAQISLSERMIDEKVYRKIITPFDELNFPAQLAAQFHQAIREKGEELLSQDKKKGKLIRMVLFNGFQSVKLVSLNSPQVIIDTLLNL